VDESTLRQQLANTEKRLERERVAREQAEVQLIDKTHELESVAERYQQSQKKLELALWASQESFWDWQANTDLMEIRSFSLDSESVSIWSGTPIDLMENIHQDDIDNLQFQWSMALHGSRDRLEISFRMRIEERYQWVRLRGRVLSRGKSGEALNIVGTTKDITQQRKAEQSFNLMASAFSSSREPMLVLSSALVITECNDAFVKLINAPAKDACIGVKFNELLQGETVQLAQFQYEKQARFESEIIPRYGEPTTVDISIALFETHHQTSSYLIATLRDISDRKRADARLKKLALNDNLTGLSNRNALREVFQSLYDDKSEFVVVFIDLDGFKAINDAAGHEQGDAALQRVAGLSLSYFGTMGEVARWGGDEFIVLLPNHTVSFAQEKSERLINDIENSSIPLNGIELRLSASIGIAHFPFDSKTIEGIVQCADAAMYQAKKLGKGQVFVYVEGLYESVTEQVTMINDLRRSVQNHLLDFYIQGKYDLQGNLKGGEVLCRWISGLHGVVSPEVFIPIAEEHKLDSQIGLQALEAACDYIAMMESQHGTAIPLSINISANQILDKDFPFQAAALCKSGNIDAQMIEIELTESVFIRDNQAALTALNKLRELGFRLSLDDFGSGFSSLSYLKSFQFEVVKVDRSLVKDIHKNSKANALFNGLVAMLSRLNIEIVAEGVEEESYLPFMKEADVTLMQGFYFDKPMPYDQFLVTHTMTPERPIRNRV